MHVVVEEDGKVQWKRMGIFRVRGLHGAGKEDGKVQWKIIAEEV